MKFTTFVLAFILLVAFAAAAPKRLVGDERPGQGSGNKRPEKLPQGGKGQGKNPEGSGKPQKQTPEARNIEEDMTHVNPLILLELKFMEFVRMLMDPTLVEVSPA